MDQVDTIADLEIKFSKITTQMSDLNDALKKVDDEIKEIENIKSIDEPDEGDNSDDDNHIIKTSTTFVHSCVSCVVYICVKLIC